MNKKTIMVIAGVVIVAIIALIVTLFALNNKEEVKLDLANINTQITNNTYFGEIMTMELDKETIQTLMEIPEEQVEEVVGKIPMVNVQASMYIIAKATPGNVNAVKEKIEAYGNTQDEIWSRYLPEQYEYVKNRKIVVKGDYVYMVIAENVEEIENFIK